MEQTSVRYRTRQVADVQVYYREAGDKGKPILLLLHGFPTSSHMFRELIPLLARDFHVVAPDLPGFGQTVTPKGYQFTFAALAETIDCFTRELGLSRFGIYVFDYGAPVGFRLALKEVGETPGRIAAVISQNGNAYEEGLSEAWQPLRAYWADKSQANRDALRGLLTPESVRWQYATGADPDRLAPDGYLLDSALLTRPGQQDIQLDLFGDYGSNVALYPQFQEWLRSRRIPVLAVWGKHDPFFLPAGAESFRRDVPDAEVHLLDAGHFALETHAAEIAARIGAFLPAKMDVATPASVVESFYAAISRGDAEAVLALLDTDVVWTESERFPYYDGPFHGIDEVRDKLLRRVPVDWSYFTASAHDFVVDGERVFTQGTYRGRHRQSGKELQAAFAHVWTIRHGKIAAFTMHTDTAKVLEAMV